ncbi:DarT ssDNA thymidine ADP-ribosyltransferase family protein [Deinococcus fonticola]|uniref:DarT ssDNA thymidine ADP-ribosyltransferase family protein n=1 Tax=Deinococcus fonticola TaxID=2528713 RepID=UPI001074A558|nr:DarT ssDNA thymidine ADP-ribosyltransferase family protein [Deinococcus fonticola]
MSAREQYAVLLNGRLVGNSPFIFNTRQEVERLVLLLGHITGARASAVQRGWVQKNAPPFDLQQVSSWLDQYGPQLMQRAYRRPDDVPQVTLRELVWPPDAWGESNSVQYSANSDTVHYAFPPLEDLPDGAEYPEFRDGPDGNLFDIITASHDLDEWNVSRSPSSHCIKVDGGWIDVSDLKHLHGGVQYRHRPLSELPELDPVSKLPMTKAQETSSERTTLQTPPPVSLITPPTKPQVQVAPTADWDFDDFPTDDELDTAHSIPHTALVTPDPAATNVYEIRWNDQVLGGQAFQFESRAAALQLLRHLHGVVPGVVSLVEAHSGSKFDATLLLDWLMGHGQASLREVAGPLSSRLGLRIPIPDLAPATGTVCKFEIEGHVIVNCAIAFTSVEASQALRKALSDTLRKSVTSYSSSDRLARPFDLVWFAAEVEWVGWVNPVHAATWQSDLARSFQHHLRQNPPRFRVLIPSFKVNVRYIPDVESPVRSREDELRRLVEDRGIRHLVHFTRLENLPGILKHGILSRGVLGDQGCVWNDGWRGDGRRHANCLSVSYPNYKMFYNYRQQVGGSWAVLLLDPCLLWELDCGFTEVNAASTGVAQRTEASLKTVDAFEALFQNDELRRKLLLPSRYPTNPQAEVLVFEGIHPTFIQEIHLEEHLDASFPLSYEDHIITMKTDTRYFWGRHDYEYWRNPLAF